MDETLGTGPIFRAEEDENSVGHYGLILGPKNAHFCPKMSLWCPTLFLSSSAQKIGPVPQVSSILVIIEYGFNPHPSLHMTSCPPLYY